MDERYRVFVGSTFLDLQQERQAVVQALLELDCIPAGMELFPAADDDQWTLVEKVVDQCDYYLVIVAGRYGSLAPNGQSYTELEYRYAIEAGKPVIGFLHKAPETLPPTRCEFHEEGEKRLGEFRSLVQREVCKFWDSQGDLDRQVSGGLIRLIESRPAVGWVRADEISLDAKDTIARLESQRFDSARELGDANGKVALLEAKLKAATGAKAGYSAELEASIAQLKADAAGRSEELAQAKKTLKSAQERNSRLEVVVREAIEARDREMNTRADDQKMIASLRADLDETKTRAESLRASLDKKFPDLKDQGIAYQAAHTGRPKDRTAAREGLFVPVIDEPVSIWPVLAGALLGMAALGWASREPGVSFLGGLLGGGLGAAIASTHRYFRQRK